MHTYVQRCPNHIISCGPGYCPQLETAHYEDTGGALSALSMSHRIPRITLLRSKSLEALKLWDLTMSTAILLFPLRQLTLQVSDKQAPIGFLIHPVLEGAALLASFWVSPQEIDFLAIPDRVFHKFPNQLLLHCCIGDVISGAMNKKNRNNPEMKGWKIIKHAELWQGKSKK